MVGSVLVFRVLFLDLEYGERSVFDLIQVSGMKFPLLQLWARTVTLRRIAELLLQLFQVPVINLFSLFHFILNTFTIYKFGKGCISIDIDVYTNLIKMRKI